jgi:predicted transcriptional regulator
MIIAKATDRKSRSDSILVSFHSRWEKPFLQNQIRVIFRKRVPTSYTPSFLYIYLNRPSSRVIARANIKKIDFVGLDEALKLSKKAAITTNELKSYMTGRDDVGMYFLKSVELATKPFSLEEMRENMRFTPPQSFVILSKNANNMIRKRCGFS